MKVIIDLTNLTTDIIDSTPFIQGIDNVRNIIEVYTATAITNAQVSYTYQNGRSSIALGNNNGTENNTVTIGSTSYYRFVFNLPETATRDSGQLMATLIIKKSDNKIVKFNVVNSVLKSSDFEAFVSALDSQAATIISRLDGVDLDITGLQTNIGNHNTRITALEGNDTTQDTKIGLLNTEVFGDSTGANPTHDGLQYIVRTDHEDRLDTIEAYITEVDPIIDGIEGDHEAIVDLQTDNTSNKSRLDDLETAVGSAVNPSSDSLRYKAASLQSQIDGINAGQNLADIVELRTDLTTYDVTNLKVNDKIQVLKDASYGNASTVYNWINDGQHISGRDYVQNTASQGYFIYIGRYGQDSYTKGYIDENLVPKTRKVNDHALSGDITITKGDVGLGNVDNTSDAGKPISTATQTALDLKADKLNTYTKTEVDSIASSGYAINWEVLCDIYNEVYADDPLITMLDSINGEVI